MRRRGKDGSVATKIAVHLSPLVPIALGIGLRIVITGNLGYIGPVVVAYLRRVFPAWELVGADTGFFQHCVVASNSPNPERFLTTQHFVDMRDVDRSVFEGADAVVHLAALSNDPLGKQYEALTNDINLEASVRVEEQARMAGVKSFVFASSCSMYGSVGNSARSETDELEPLTAYARSKVDFEEHLASTARSDSNVTALRFATACGASPRLRLDLVLNDFVATGLATRKVVLLSDGSPWRPLIDVRDMARAIEWALTERSRIVEPFLPINVGNARNNVQMIDLAQRVARVIPKTEVHFTSEPPADSRSYSVDFSKFVKMAPRHQPRSTIDDSIRQLVTQLETADSQTDSARDGRLSRLHELRRLEGLGAINSDLRWMPISLSGTAS